MAKGQRTYTSQEVLCWRSKASRSTVRRHYEHSREEEKIPPRCDESKCNFHTQPPTWNDKPLPLILDHISGNRKDDRPENLHYLCPNCDSQLSTRGGANKGRVLEEHENGFTLFDKDTGTRGYTFFPSAGIIMGVSAVMSSSSANEEPSLPSKSAQHQKELE